jgi:hypothetical protein
MIPLMPQHINRSLQSYVIFMALYTTLNPDPLCEVFLLNHNSQLLLHHGLNEINNRLKTCPMSSLKWESQSLKPGWRLNYILRCVSVLLLQLQLLILLKIIMMMVALMIFHQLKTSYLRRSTKRRRILSVKPSSRATIRICAHLKSVGGDEPWAQL